MRKGYTLLELVVCVAVALALASLLLPAIQAARRAARRAQCQSNLHQLCIHVCRQEEIAGRLPAYWVEPHGVPYCPEAVAEIERIGLPAYKAQYEQRWHGCKRQWVLEECQQSGDVIPMLLDCRDGLHGEGRQVAYLNGNVGQWISE